MSCACGLPGDQPWRGRDTVWSPASFLGGIVIVVLAVVALAAGRTWFAVVLFGMLLASFLVALVVQIRHGHRGWCLTRRALWFALAAPGAPVRLLVNSP